MRLPTCIFLLSHCGVLQPAAWGSARTLGMQHRTPVQLLTKLPAALISILLFMELSPLELCVLVWFLLQPRQRCMKEAVAEGRMENLSSCCLEG